MRQKLLMFRDIVEARRSNKHTSWSGDGGPETAAHRIRNDDFVKVAVKPKFKIRRSGCVLTIGSCFARNIERKLSASGIEVAADIFHLPSTAYVADRADPRSALNKYNTHSIESEIRSALGDIQYLHEGLIEVGDGLWWDPLATLTRPDTYENVLEIRQQIQAVTRRLAGADMVIITLGLNEAWIDRETGVYMNLMPPTNLIRRQPEPRRETVWTGRSPRWSSCLSSAWSKNTISPWPDWNACWPPWRRASARFRSAET